MVVVAPAMTSQVTMDISEEWKGRACIAMKSDDPPEQNQKASHSNQGNSNEVWSPSGINEKDTQAQELSLVHVQFSDQNSSEDAEKVSEESPPPRSGTIGGSIEEKRNAQYQVSKTTDRANKELKIFVQKKKRSKKHGMIEQPPVHVELINASHNENRTHKEQGKSTFGCCAGARE